MLVRNFHMYLGKDAFITLYKALVRSHLEYLNAVKVKLTIISLTKPDQPGP